MVNPHLGNRYPNLSVCSPTTLPSISSYLVCPPDPAPSLSPSPEYTYQKQAHRPELTYLYSPLYKRVQLYFPYRERSTISNVS